MICNLLLMLFRTIVICNVIRFIEFSLLYDYRITIKNMTTKKLPDHGAIIY